MRARAGEEGENSLLSLHLSIFPSLSPSTTTAAVRLRRLDHSTVREATPPRAAPPARPTTMEMGPAARSRASDLPPPRPPPPPATASVPPAPGPFTARLMNSV